MHNLE